MVVPRYTYILYRCRWLETTTPFLLIPYHTIVILVRFYIKYVFIVEKDNDTINIVLIGLLMETMWLIFMIRKK